MPSHLIRTLLAFAGFAVLAASPAQAQDLISSSNMSHVSNIRYEQRWEMTSQAGSDLEFKTFTISDAVAQSLPVSPKFPVTPLANKKAKKKASKYSKCVKKAKKVKNKSKRKKALKKCKKLKKKTKKKAKRSQVDVDAAKPGIQRTFAFAGTYNNGLQIIDVSVPDKPVPVVAYDCGISQGDVQIFTRPDLNNRTFVAYASDDSYAFQGESTCFTEAAAAGFDAEGQSGDGTFIIDVTNPLKPKTVSFAYFQKGSHNQTVHPSGKYLYNSNSDLATDPAPGIEVADITDVTKPKLVATLALPVRPGLGSNSHDIYFNPDGNRAYSAAVSDGVIIDTTNPAAPTVVSSIFDPSVNVWHQAEPMEADVPGLGKRTVLIVSDEAAGATSTGECPSGGLHVFDITGANEQAPVKLGYFNIDEARQTANGTGVCTAHVFQLDRENKVMIIAWYNAGVRVLDMSTIVGAAFSGNGQGIKELGFARFPDSDTWAVKTPTAMTSKGVFYMYGNDETRGFDTYKFDGSKTAAGLAR